MDIFAHSGHLPPLAERLRPSSLQQFIGQSHLMGEGKILRRAIEKDQLVSMIFWGPPGVGKTTLARIIAAETHSEFFSMSAVTTGVAELRRLIKDAAERRKIGTRTILFIDEIHRFNKGQQDALLHSVEDGTILLIGATTENPGFEVNSALLSRCRVFKLESLSPEELELVLRRALATDKTLQELNLDLTASAKEALIRLAGGD
ncbi:MAG: AAA family ATPase, partial [Calditrichaeota bacterium]